MYDLIIVGSGPAGLTAAIYATRAKLNFIIIEQNFMSGGQVVNTYEVDNYPATPGINGMDLSMQMREHAEKLGAEFITAEVTALELAGDVKKVVTDDETYEAKTVILAMGANHRKLGVPGELELAGMGVSYCATCDGAFFRNRKVAVVGGGDVAVEDAIFLARLCSKVYVIHRRDELRAAKVLQDRLLALENVEMLWSRTLTSISGENGQVSSILTASTKGEGDREVAVSGVFMEVGIQPTNSLVKGQLELDRSGYIIAGEDGKTSLPGVFAAGDLRTKQLRQIITACADGANCVTSVQDYLITH